MKILTRILGIASAVCYLLIAAVLFVAAPLAVGFKPVVVLTGSMEPAFSPGTVIYYKSVSFESVQKDDIISFSKNDDARSMVTHRVYAVDEQRREFRTKGDANNAPDPRPVAFADVRGKVMNYHLPVVGFGVKYIQNYYVIGSVFILLLAKMIVDRVNERYKESGGTPFKGENGQP